jgi:hypothetical protein
VGTRAVLAAVEKRKIPKHRRESNPRTPIFQSVAQRNRKVEGKGKVVSDLNWATRHKDILGRAFLTSARDGGKRSASRPNRFTPGETAPCTHWKGGLVETDIKVILNGQYKMSA